MQISYSEPLSQGLKLCDSLVGVTRATSPAVIAHRGASAAARENSIGAFELAVELGSDGVELDVRRTADGLLVVHHDAHLEDGRGIADLRSEELPDHVPTLTAALDACGELTVNVEIKNSESDHGFDVSRRIADETMALVDDRATPSRYLISSFDLPTVDRAAAVSPSPSAWLVYGGDPESLCQLCRARGHGVIHPWDRQVDAEFMSHARAADLTVNVWTVDDPERMEELVRLGVDGIVTNVPDVARRVLD